MKKKLQKSILVFSISIIASLGVYAQDPHFSQFYANPIYLNPALTGETECGRINLNYRNQWPSLGKAFITYSATYDQSVPVINSGVGVSFVADQMGDGGALSRNYISGFYAYNLQVSESVVVNAGFQGTFIQESLNWSELIFEDQINPGNGSINPSSLESPPSDLDKSFIDFSAGLMLGYLDKFYGGLAVHHLTEPTDGFYEGSDSKIHMKITVHGGTNINLSTGSFGMGSDEELTFSPNILYQQQDVFQELNLGGYFTKYPFVGGVWYRHAFENPDAAVVLFGIKQPRYRIGYSYDFSLSELSNISGGAHEISFAWHFCVYSGEKRRKIRAIKSPTF